MKKIFAGVLVVGTVLLSSCGNKQVLDTIYKYDKAILSLPDGSIVSGEVQSWSDYDDGDQIQVKINGTTYLVHSVNVVLIHK
nr:MAG TPA: protein of unknown function (DUF4969) [Caudoviricetes sp.]